MDYLFILKKRKPLKNIKSRNFSNEDLFNEELKKFQKNQSKLFYTNFMVKK